jgi:glycosyltransferase involved in cell wall biosynthesis
MLNWRDIRNRKAGGAAIVTHEYAKRWVKKGHSVTLFTASFKGASSQEVLDGVRIIRQGGPYTVHLCAFWCYLTRLQGQYDVVIDQIHGIPFFTPLYVTNRHIIAFIHEVAGEIWHYMYPFPFNWIGIMAESLYFRFYRRVQFVTDAQSTKDDLVRKGIKRSQVTVVFPGVSASPLDQLPLKESEPTIIFVGRLCQMKGIEEALSAFSLVLASLPMAKLWVVGTGDEQYVQALRGKVQDLSLENKVRFLGFVSEQRKLGLLRRAHLLVHPSVKEGWGLVVIEANTRGTPAVGYRVSGLRDSIQDGKTGLLVEAHNAVSLAEAMIKVLRDDDHRDYLSSNALEWSRQFSWDEAAGKFLTIIEEAEKW